MKCANGHEHAGSDPPGDDDDLLLKQYFSDWPGEEMHSATMAEAGALWPSGTREDGTAYGLMKCNAKGIAEGRLLLGKGRMQVRHLKGASFESRVLSALFLHA